MWGRSLRCFMTRPSARLAALQRQLHAGVARAASSADSAPHGVLHIGPHVTIPVATPSAPERVPPARLWLDTADPIVQEHLEFLAKKWLLQQDVFLSSPPGPYARRLCQTFAALIQVPVEYVVLHRDIGEAELLQSRSLEVGGNLRYEDGPVVRAMKYGRILVLDGIERAERGVMPILNNILENREQNLADGTQLVPVERLAQHAADGAGHARFIPVHKDFRVFCIGLPVPPYRGHPLDPPFRSRFQARWVEGAVHDTESPADPSAAARALQERLGAWAALQQAHADATRATGLLPTSAQLPHVPTTALPLLRSAAATFPPGTRAGGAPATMALLATAYPALLSLDKPKRQMLHELVDKAELRVDSVPGAGLLGYALCHVERTSPAAARVTFRHTSGSTITADVPCGPEPLVPLERLGDETQALLTPRLRTLLATMVQLHALGRDILLVPAQLVGPPSHASSSKATCIQLFAALLGYRVETVWLWRDVTGTELTMRRATTPDGATVWQPAPLTRGVLEGALVHLAGIDVLGPTIDSLARLTNDRELDLWEGTRLSLGASAPLRTGDVCGLPATTRVVASAPKIGDWLSESVATLFATLPSPPMSEDEERRVVAARADVADLALLDRLFAFAARYRTQAADASGGLHKARQLGTRQLVRVARRLQRWPDEDLYALLWRNQLCDFLPRTVRDVVDDLLRSSGLVPHGTEGAVQYIPPLELSAPELDAHTLRFRDMRGRERLAVPRYAWRKVDPNGAALVPNAHGTFHHNAQQTRLMYALVQDLAVLGEHVLLMGAQGTGKNKVMDQMLELLDRPREYIQLNRDSTVGELLQRAYLEDGQLRYADSPLVRALRLGRVAVVDEVDKASASVSAVFKSLAERGELTLPDGRRVVPRSAANASDAIQVHPDFRLVLLANRPGWPFLGNSFTEVIGEGFSAYAVANPDAASELELLSRLAPNVDRELLTALVAAFQDLRRAFDEDQLSHPYSLRELIHIVRHLRQFPREDLGDVMQNMLAFDLHRPETMELIARAFARHGLRVGPLSVAAVRAREIEAARSKGHRIEYKPLGDTSLSEPKDGKDDPNNDPHVGGNTWRGGTGGRDTAGLGGRGGYERLYKGHKIHQIPEHLKRDVPPHILDKAREMAQRALAEKLAVDRLDQEQAEYMQAIKKRVEPQVAHLANVLNALTANDHERRWAVRQQDGQLDERRLSDGLVGERAIFKRRTEAPPEIGAPQLKPKRIRIVLDASASMYHMQFDGRLTRELETALMVMEAMTRVDPTRFAFDMVAHSGDSVVIPLVKLGAPPRTDGDRFRLLRDIVLHMQYCMSGDNTVECIEQSVKDVRSEDADDYFVIALSDANLSRYGIHPAKLGAALRRDDKVKAAVVFIDRSPEATDLAHALPGRAFVAQDTREIPRVLSDILTAMMK